MKILHHEKKKQSEIESLIASIKYYYVEKCHIQSLHLL